MTLVTEHIFGAVRQTSVQFGKRRCTLESSVHLQANFHGNFRRQVHRRLKSALKIRIPPSEPAVAADQLPAIAACQVSAIAAGQDPAPSPDTQKGTPPKRRPFGDPVTWQWRMRITPQRPRTHPGQRRTRGRRSPRAARGCRPRPRSRKQRKRTCKSCQP